MSLNQRGEWLSHHAYFLFAATAAAHCLVLTVQRSVLNAHCLVLTAMPLLAA